MNASLIEFLQGFDEFMNLVLEDGEEVDVKQNTRVKIGKVLKFRKRIGQLYLSYHILGRLMLKGDNITLIQGVEN